MMEGFNGRLAFGFAAIGGAASLHLFNSEWAQTALLGVTAAIILWYTHETRRLAERADEQANLQRQSNEFSASTAIHARLTSERSSAARGYLHESFPSHLAEAVGAVLGPDYVSVIEGGQVVNVAAVLKGLGEDQDKLSRLRDRLQGRTVPGVGLTLDAVESALMDFHIIAIPYAMGIEAVEPLAETYRPALERTAPALLPFVAIQRKLRGEGDRYYHTHYLHLLRSLNIDVQGIDFPDPPGLRRKIG